MREFTINKLKGQNQIYSNKYYSHTSYFVSSFFFRFKIGFFFIYDLVYIVRFVSIRFVSCHTHMYTFLYMYKRVTTNYTVYLTFTYLFVSDELDFSLCVFFFIHVFTTYYL